MRLWRRESAWRSWHDLAVAYRQMILERDDRVAELEEALEWLSTCNPDTNDVNAIAAAALQPGKEAS